MHLFDGQDDQDVCARKKKLEAIRSVVTRDNKNRAEEIRHELLDYAMSEKFGLDWQNYDAQRMNYIISIMGSIREKERIEERKNNMKNNGGRNR